MSFHRSHALLVCLAVFVTADHVNDTNTYTITYTITLPI